MRKKKYSNFVENTTGNYKWKFNKYKQYQENMLLLNV